MIYVFCGSGKKYKKYCGKQLKALNRGFFYTKNHKHYTIEEVKNKYGKLVENKIIESNLKR